MASLSTGVMFDEIPSLRDLNPADPYSAYAEMFGPPLLVSGGNAAVVTRHSTCATLLRHPDVSLRRDTSRVFRGLNSSFLNVLDPPEHTRIRSLVNHAFTPRSVMLLTPWLHDRVNQLLDHVRGETFDVIEDLAYPLPVNAICQLLDIPDDDRDLVMTWSRPITLGADLLASRRSRDDQKLYRSALRAFRLYIKELVAARRASPGTDLISRLLSVDEAGDRLTEREVIVTAIGLLITGHETTVSLIGHGALALVANPELCDSVGHD